MRLRKRFNFAIIIHMNVYAISDPHLSTIVNKPMTIFGEHWNNYWEIITEDWKSKVKDDDIVIVAGDISWGISLEEANPDIDKIAALPGKIVIGKGNHDFWWPSLTKLKSWLPSNIYVQFSNCLRFDNILICGSRLWTIGPNATTEDKRILEKHEVPRLIKSLDEMQAQRKEGDIVIAMTHFPPFDIQMQEKRFTKIFEDYKVDKVVYGHLHGDICKPKETHVVINDIDYYLTACDQVGHHLVKIL